ncbi:arrestin domain-containing protein 2 [Copidosoma floridanum]|uniref:arrestin domain-containing protein 2 n=1 Tax=Copidosoma floridanum TaxID=29053 RepID=UPI0006C9AB14|nr:arrestin domain-containing protein 2 [Copidosoma floridanum]
MPKLQDLRIDFNKSGAIYLPGEIVSGRVFLRLSGSKNIREIRMEASGEAETHWTKKKRDKDSSGRSQTRIEHYRGNQHYFSVTNRLLGNGIGDEHSTLPSGEHSYHFSFQLPSNIPCSIEHELGFVRYTVRVLLTRPWKFDHKVISAFSVISSYDLNAVYDLSTGISEEFRRNFRYWCVLSDGGVNIRLGSRVKGFVPGETIELVVKYDNNSTRVDLTKMKLNLEKSMTFYTSSPKDKKLSSEIVKKTKVVGPFPKIGETILKLEVPPVPPSRLENCSLIDLCYKLNLTLSVSGLRFPIKKSYPVEIGTVPIYGRAAAAGTIPAPPCAAPVAPLIEQMSPAVGQHTSQSVNPIGFVIVGAPPSVTSGVPQLVPMDAMPPPAYEECISGSKTITPIEQGMYGADVQFAPRYPVYRFPTPRPYST